MPGRHGVKVIQNEEFVPQVEGVRHPILFTSVPFCNTTGMALLFTESGVVDWWSRYCRTLFGDGYRTGFGSTFQH